MNTRLQNALLYNYSKTRGGMNVKDLRKECEKRGIKASRMKRSEMIVALKNYMSSSKSKKLARCLKRNKALQKERDQYAMLVKSKTRSAKRRKMAKRHGLYLPSSSSQLKPFSDELQMAKMGLRKVQY